MATLEEVLEHHGIKGMRWGVRRRSTGGSSSTSEDAKRAASTHAIVKTHGTSAVSSQDLQHLVGRMNLEQQYSRLSTSQKSAGAKFAKDILVQVGKQQASKLLSDALTSAVAKNK